MYLVGIEAGGTTFKVGIAKGDAPDAILATRVVPTSTPEKTVQACIEVIHEFEKQYNPIQSMGIASFGPLALDEEADNYGCITTTPKKAWQNAPLRDMFVKAFPKVPIGFETDVNAPALSEYEVHRRHDKTIRSCAYITVGTGVGVGLVVDGKPVHGMVHPEGGHCYVPLHPEDVSFKGTCSFHGQCVEGMVNAASIVARTQQDGASLDDDHPVWPKVAHYLSHLCLNILLLTSAEKIVLGGGVLKRQVLLPLIQQKTQSLLKGYVTMKRPFSEYIVLSQFGEHSGLIGALFLAFKSQG